MGERIEGQRGVRKRKRRPTCPEGKYPLEPCDADVLPARLEFAEERTRSKVLPFEGEEVAFSVSVRLRGDGALKVSFQLGDDKEFDLPDGGKKGVAREGVGIEPREDWSGGTH